MSQYEEIIKCPKTGVELCYKTQVAPEIFNYMSLACGFYTNSLMKEGEEFYEETMEGLPEIYKAISWVDEETGLTWIPNMAHDPEKGMVFASGLPNEWGWVSVQAIKIEEEDREKHPIPGKPGEFMTYKMDMKNGRSFKENEYMIALQYANLI